MLSSVVRFLCTADDSYKEEDTLWSGGRSGEKACCGQKPGYDADPPDIALEKSRYH